MGGFLEQTGFEAPKLLWQLVNLVVLGLFLALPIWLVTKINSIDKSLKELLRRLDK